MNKISKEEAINLGLKRFFTGIPCRNRHITERRLNGYGGECVECSRLRGNKRLDKKFITNKQWWESVDRRQRFILKQRGRAKDRNIEFNLQKEDIILIENCPILGIKLDYYSSSTSADNIATIDRIDNKKGYIKGNIQIISFKANRLKNDANLAELEKIVNYLKGLKIE